MEKFRILRSRGTDPAVHLALEEKLIEEGIPTLFLWQNRPCVVIGRNQNPYRECRPAVLYDEGIVLIRRRSGGGAVYHDLGNLNFTLITPKYEGVIEDNFRLIQGALLRCGIQAEVSGRNDLEVAGRKVSGSAFFEEGDTFCHHGTLLLHVDLQRMSHCLTVAPQKLESKGIVSVRARVANLTEFVPDLSVDQVCAALCAECGGQAVDLSAKQLAADPSLTEKIERYRSWEWIYGECPPYNLRLTEKFSWGLAEAEIYVDSGRIRQCRIFTDSLQTDGFEAVSEALVGACLTKEELSGRLAAAVEAPQLRADLQKLLFQSISPQV